MQAIQKVTIYSAQKIAGKTGMGGWLNIDGAVAIRNPINSIDPVFAELAMARAKQKHPDWVVEIVASKVDAAWFGAPSQEAVKKAKAALNLLNG